MSSSTFLGSVRITNMIVHETFNVPSRRHKCIVIIVNAIQIPLFIEVSRVSLYV